MFKDKRKRSFLEKLTGSISLNDDVFEEDEVVQEITPTIQEEDWVEEEAEEGQLTVDVFQTQEDIILKTMVAGVKPEDMSVTITRDMVTIKGRREEDRSIIEDDYFFKELYWGAFSRTILLPEEVDPNEAEAIEKHGLLTIRLPKIDKKKTNKLKVKSG